MTNLNPNMRATQGHATAQDFAKWAEHAKTLDDSSLRYVMDDCATAQESMRGWNPEREGYYADQRFTYADELRRRMNRRKAK